MNGPLDCKLGGVEVMGRDVSVVCRHEAAVSPTMRAIISSESSAKASGERVRFSLKPGKIFAFDKATERRLNLGAER